MIQAGARDSIFNHVRPLEGLAAASFSGLKVPEHEAAHFHLLPRLRMSGIALCMRCVHRCIFFFTVFGRRSLALVGQSPLLCGRVKGERGGFRVAQIHMWFTAFGRFRVLYDSRPVVPRM
jgi:hypothetical protein